LNEYLTNRGFLARSHKAAEPSRWRRRRSSRETRLDSGPGLSLLECVLHRRAVIQIAALGEIYFVEFSPMMATP